MKNIYVFSLWVFVSLYWISGISTLAQNSISGSTKYARKNFNGVFSPVTVGNPAGTCDSIRVILKQGNTIIDTACPDAIGVYTFSNLPNGTFTVEAWVNKMWGGVGSADAQAIMRHFVNLNGFSLYPDGYFTNIYLLAADVNGVGGENSVDALLCQKRFVGLIPNFGRPDYTTEKHTIVLSGGNNINQDILVLCTGDVNGTFTPPLP